MKFAVGLARAILVATGVLATAATGPALGQSLFPSPQELNPAERSPPPPSASRGDILAPPEPGACPLRSSDLRFVLQEVIFTAAQAITPQELAPAYAGLAGREVPVSALCDIRDRALQILFARGLLARVEIPQQRITEGRVTFEIIEAYLASVRVTGDIGPGQSKVEDYIEMLRGMRPFDLTSAQRYLLLASDVPGVVVSATLRPSAAGRGAVDLEVNVSRDALAGVVNVQNFGSQETGPFGAVARADLNSFTTFGERTSLVVYSTLDGREQRVVQILEEMRFGSEGLLGRFSLAYGETRPGGSFSTIEMKGPSWVGAVGLSYPLVRLRASNVNLMGGLDYVDQRLDVAGTRLTDDKLRVLFLGLDVERRWFSRIPIAVGGAFVLRKGLSILGASGEGDPNLSRLNANPEALTLRGDARAAVQLFPRFTATLRLIAQYADDPLLGYEEMPIGNLTIGRGYDPAALSGDRGVATSLQIDLGGFGLGGAGEIGLFGFGDLAMVDNLDPDGIERTVRSVGLGLTWQLAGRLRFDVTYAHPLDPLSEFVLEAPEDRVLVNMIVRF
jgi:hemolysin activation/secretion protein